MFAPDVLGPTVDLLAELAGDGRALEFAIGTGRVAISLAEHHFRFGDGRYAKLFRSPHRYIWPAELDLMAQLAGFQLESRHADWDGSEFTAESRSHVSAYRIPTVS